MKKVVHAPLVSVIIPNYNHFKYLEQRLDSVFNQTFQDFEVIIIDDCSTDNSIVILNKYKNHPKVSHFILNKKNSGSPFMQWKKGIELAKGKFIWIAETDDFAETEFLETTVAVLQNNQNSNLVYVDSKIVNSKDNSMGFWSTRKNIRFKTTKWSKNHEAIGRNEVIDFLLNSVTINNASAVLFRRKSLDIPTFLNELSKYKTAGDLFTYIFVVLQGKISYISQPLNNFREHELNVTKKNTQSGLIYRERIKCLGKSLNLLENFNLTANEFDKLKESYKLILRKNGFKLADIGLINELDVFIKRIIKASILTNYEGFFYRNLFVLYSFDSGIFKKVSKKLIKRFL